MFVTDDSRWKRRDSYQGTPSGVREIDYKRSPAIAAAMAIPSRHSEFSNVAAGARTFFVTSWIAEKRNLLQSDRAAELFIRVLYDYRAQNKFRLHEFVVMPDHFHLLLTVGSEITIDRSIQFIKGGFAFRAGRELGFRAPAWQRGFSEVRIRDAEAVRQTREYIRNNPVAKRLAYAAEEYPHSSAHAGFELDAIPQGLKPVALVDRGGMAEATP